MKNFAIVLAAGFGKRMMSKKPKALQPILKKPLISIVTNSLQRANIEKNNICVVLGHKKEDILPFTDGMMISTQAEQLGTADAVNSAREHLANKKGSTIIMPVDVPLFSDTQIAQMFDTHNKNNNDITLLTTIVPDPTGYGRIIRDSNNNIQAIVEQKDATEEQLKITEINTGIYIVGNQVLFNLLEKVVPSKVTGEFYLTDIIKIGLIDSLKVDTIITEDYASVEGANTKLQLVNLEKELRKRINEKWLLEGVLITDPATTYIDSDVVLEADATIYPNTHLYGNTKVVSGAVIGPNVCLINATIGGGSKVFNSTITDSHVGANTTVGPYAHLRNNASLADGVRIGNFVEIKNSTLEDAAKSAHLAYIGDAEVKTGTNIGAGVITANYDGVNKSKTTIEENVFVGSNSVLIAPIRVEKNSKIAAGSIITDDVPKESLAIARSRQNTKKDYFKNK